MSCDIVNLYTYRTIYYNIYGTVKVQCCTHLHVQFCLKSLKSQIKGVAPVSLVAKSETAATLAFFAITSKIAQGHIVLVRKPYLSVIHLYVPQVF